MSNSGSSLAGEKSTSPEEIIRISADALAEHATNTVDVITESLSANELIDTGFVAKSETAAETWAKAIIGHGLEGSLGRKGESSSGNKGDTSSGRRSESSAGRPKDTSAQAGDAILGDTGAGYRDGVKAGHESAASPGHDAGVYIPDVSIEDEVLLSADKAECVCRVITLGFYKSPHAYLRNIYNKLDFVIVVDSWVHMVRTLLKDEDAFLRLAVLRLFRALVILRHLTFIGNVLAILDAIIKSIGTLELVIIFSFIFLFFYSAVGTQYFTGFLSFRGVRVQIMGRPTLTTLLQHSLF